jgi:hypothetical protein
MPTTVNGVGTHYYGKRNVSVRTAACKACHRVGPLTSYDTRLWFVVVFVPVIPLGRKRIIDYCSACSRHYSAGADAYEQAKQLQTSAALEEFRREPTADTALAAHAQLLTFHEHDQAAQLRGAALEMFPGHAGLRIGLAQQLQQVSSYEESARLFQEAHALAPADPDARAGVAFRKMNEGDLDGARALLDFLEEPGAGRQHNLGPLDVLASCYQRARRHEEALELAAVLLRELPHVGNQYKFRAFVRKSEKALRRPESILPKQPFSLGGLFRSKDSPYAPWQRAVAIGDAVLLLLAAGLAVNNEYIRRHRTLYVANALGAPVQVAVDGGPAVAVASLGKLEVAEGPHTVSVRGPVEETHQVNLEAGYFDRWFKTPGWVLNPGGEAVLGEVEHVYAANPPPGRQRVIVGQTFFSGPDYDYLFEPAPNSLSVDNKNKVVQKTELAWVQGRDADAFQAAMAGDRAAALEFARRRLKRNPADRPLLKAYLNHADDEDELPRARELLSSRLDARPINVPWHRAYQSLAEGDTPEAELRAQYDRSLAAEPKSAALLYLRGRIEPDAARQEDYYRRAADADGKLAWPWVGLAALAEGRGQWPEALAAVARAKERQPEDTELLDDLAHTARLASGEAEKVAGEYRTRLAANPFDLPAVIYQIEALSAAGKAAEADAAAAALEGRLPPEVRAQLGPQLRSAALYMEGKAQECEALCAQTESQRHGPVRAEALLALGKAREAADDPAFAKVWDDPWHALALSVAFGLEGRADDAAKWRDRARGKLKQARVAGLLAAAEPPPADGLAALHLRLPEKAILLAALAQRFPAKKDEYLKRASAVNVRRSPPFLLVRRAADNKSTPRP